MKRLKPTAVPSQLLPVLICSHKIQNEGGNSNENVVDPVESLQTNIKLENSTEHLQTNVQCEELTEYGHTNIKIEDSEELMLEDSEEHMLEDLEEDMLENSEMDSLEDSEEQMQAQIESEDFSNTLNPETVYIKSEPFDYVRSYPFNLRLINYR